MRVITGFHAIEEELRSFEKDPKKASHKEHYSILIDKPGPRIKKIVETAQKLDLKITNAASQKLDALAACLPPTAQDHRGILLLIDNQDQKSELQLDDYLKLLEKKETSLLLVLDSITDPHNVGAIIRSADQFGVDLVIIPENRSATDLGIMSRTSAGASSWVPILFVSNLVRTVEQFKDIGFWVYGADAKGENTRGFPFNNKTILVMGSEGSGIARLLREKCDALVSIPTQGKLDSLNVSVAAGILLYEITGSIVQPFHA